MVCIYGVGRLTRDAEFKVTKDGTKGWLNFTLATDRGFGDNKKTDFLRCQMWCDSSRKIIDMLTKGTLLSIKGHLETSIVEKDDGKITYYNMNIDSFDGIQLLGGRPKNSQSSGSQSESTPIGTSGGSNDKEPY